MGWHIFYVLGPPVPVGVLQLIDTTQACWFFWQPMCVLKSLRPQCRVDFCGAARWPVLTNTRWSLPGNETSTPLKELDTNSPRLVLCGFAPVCFGDKA